MIRKRVYLRPEHDRKLKALAAQRGSTEAEVVHEAIDPTARPAQRPHRAARGGWSGRTQAGLL